MEESAFNIYDNLLAAVYKNKTNYYLSNADFEIAKIKYLIRLSYEKNLMTKKQYFYCVEKVIEIGKLVGGWLKKEEN